MTPAIIGFSEMMLRERLAPTAYKPKPKRRAQNKLPEPALRDTKHILQRIRKDGTSSFLVNIRYRKNGKSWSYTATFDDQPTAVRARDDALKAYQEG